MTVASSTTVSAWAAMGAIAVAKAAMAAALLVRSSRTGSGRLLAARGLKATCLGVAGAKAEAQAKTAAMTKI